MRQTPRFLDEPAAADTAAGHAPPDPPTAPATDAPERSTPMLLDAREDAPEAIGADWNPRSVGRRKRRLGSSVLAVAGLGIILGSWLLLAALGSALDLLSRSAGLGGVALALYVTGAVLMVYAAMREWLSLRRLHQVDRLRAALHGPGTDIAAARSLCATWLDRVAPHLPEAAPAAAGLSGSGDAAQLRAFLNSQLRDPLAAATRRIGFKAASEVSALVALSPHDSWDGLIVAWRGLRVIRQVAVLHGLRPGPAVSLALLGRVAHAAVETAMVDVASQAAADHLLANVPLLRHLSAIPAASTAAFRLHRLASVAGRACSPLDG